MGILDLKIDVERGSYWKSRSHYDLTSSNSDLDNSISTSNLERSSCPSSFTEDNRIHNYMDIELYRAASKNDVNGFINVLQKVSEEKDLTLHAIFESVSPQNNTLLHVAASFGNDEIVRLIADNSPSILTRRNAKGDTALHVAAKAGHGSVVSDLCLRRDYINSSSSSDHEVTVTEVDWDDNPLLRVRNKKGNTALHVALINGHTGVAEALIEADPEVSFCLNKEGKSPLYLAAQAGYKTCVVSMLVLHEYVNPDERFKGKSPIHAAIVSAATTREKTEILDFMLKEEPRFIHLRDEEGRTALHCASYIGYLDGVRYLLGKSISSAVQRDEHGLFPIHMASIKGHVDVIQELLQYCPYPAEMLCYNDQNILHVAAKSGKLNVVGYILKKPELEKLINQRDKDGNTPLHLATMQWHPKIVSVLTWDKRVDLMLINNAGLTAFDAAECYMERKASFRKRLTWRALRAAGATRAPYGKAVNADRQTYMCQEASSMDYYKDRVNTLLLVSTLVATVTFTAGFTMPGGYTCANPDDGMATMLRHSKFHVFVFCDTIALYSSIMVTVILIWAQLGDLHLVFFALRAALPLLGIALTMMSLAFMAGINLVVSELSWLANAVLIIGLVFLVALSALFFPLCFSIASSIRIYRYISYYPFCLLMLVTGSYTTTNSEE